MITEIPVTEKEKEALRKEAKKLPATEVPIPEPPKLEMVKEDFDPISALFGTGVKFNVNRQVVFDIIIFGLGIMIGFVIGRG